MAGPNTERGNPMSTSREPDYVRYTLEQLECARSTIDVERFPERTKLLDTLIADRRHWQRTSPAGASATATDGGAANTEPSAAETSLWRRPHYNTPTQALLGVVSSLIVCTVFVALTTQNALTNDAMIIAGAVCLLTLINVTYSLTEWHRLRQEANSADQQQNRSKPLIATTADPASRLRSKPQSRDSSPIERL